MRLALALGALWLLSWLRIPYRHAMVPTVVTGLQLQKMQPGLLTVTGTVAPGMHWREDGAVTFKLLADGQLITVYVPPGERVPVMPAGETRQITGTCFAPFAVSVSSMDDVRRLQATLDTSPAVEAAYADTIHERVRLPVKSLQWDDKPGKAYHGGWLNTGVRTQRVVVNAGNAEAMGEVSSVTGYLLPSNVFFVESWE